jgi:hypothetical protein
VRCYFGLISHEYRMQRRDLKQFLFWSKIPLDKLKYMSLVVFFVLMLISYFCTYDLYGPIRNVFCWMQIYYEGKWEEVGP